VISLALAALLGLAAFPLVLVFGPVYFPWTFLLLACFGGAVGLSVSPGGVRSRLLRSLGLATLMVAVVLGARLLTSNVVPDRGVSVAALVWTTWILLAPLVGVFSAAWLRARMGLVRGAGIGALAVLAVALVGAGLALALAPPEAAGAPTCDGGFECPRTQCAYVAERRRFLAIERVTVLDADHITCTYTAWGGFEIGRADIGRLGGTWTEGTWPLIVSGRGR
jgi:hypothetical protein